MESVATVTQCVGMCSARRKEECRLYREMSTAGMRLKFKLKANYMNWLWNPFVGQMIAFTASATPLFRSESNHSYEHLFFFFFSSVRENHIAQRIYVSKVCAVCVRFEADWMTYALNTEIESCGWLQRDESDSKQCGYYFLFSCAAACTHSST